VTSKRRLLIDQRGAAFLEGVVVAPVLGILLAGVVALSAMYEAKLEAKSRARRMAWLQADSGDCPPQTCAGGSCEAISQELQSSALDPAMNLQRRGLSLRTLLGRTRDFFYGTATRGMGTATRHLPRVFGKERAQQHGATTMLCNTTGRRAESGESILDYACSAGLDTTEYAREVCR
jgi:hypothetical protein